jgi:prolipoprotein diacylglyceryl transferase
VNLAAIPSPTQGVWELGPVPIRAYALCIVAGIVAAVLLSERRWVARGGAPGVIMDVAVWAVPFGIIGGRIYHVISSPRAYFGEGGDPLRAFAIWEGGLGIWGAIAFGGLGAWIACRKRGIPLPAIADTMAPGLLVAQAIGRLGNWFNNELYGGPTDLPWRLRIYEWDGGRAVLGADGEPVVLGHFHPTFLYELLWNLAAAAFLIWADRRFRLGHGRVFALYVAAYCLGRFWIELMRVDPAETLFGVRINVFTAAVLFVAALVGFFSQRGRPRESLAGRAGGWPDDRSAAAEDRRQGDRAHRSDRAADDDPPPPSDGASSPGTPADRPDDARGSGTTGPP